MLLLLLLLLLNHFSRVRLCATPYMAAHQASPSLGFSRQEHWNGLTFPSPVHESESEVTQSCPTPSDPMDCSLPGSSIHGMTDAETGEMQFEGGGKDISQGAQAVSKSRETQGNRFSTQTFRRNQLG